MKPMQTFVRVGVGDGDRAEGSADDGLGRWVSVARVAAAGLVGDVLCARELRDGSGAGPPA